MREGTPVLARSAKRKAARGASLTCGSVVARSAADRGLRFGAHQEKLGRRLRLFQSFGKKREKLASSSVLVRALGAGMGRPAGIARVALLALLACLTTHRADALPILRAPRPAVDPKEAAAAHFGVPPRSLFEGAPASADASRTDAKVSLLTHTLHGSGFHRVVSVELEASLPAHLFRVASYAKCHAAFVTELDPHLYADRFELDAAAKRKGPGHAAAVFEDAFVISEKPASVCNSSVVAVTAPLKPRPFEKPSRFAEDDDADNEARRISVFAKTEVALHNRYPKPVRAPTSLEPYVSVSLRPPRVLVRCGGGTDHANRVPRDGWALADAARGYENVFENDATWRVPAGTRAHFTFVAAATLVARYAAALFVAVAARRAPEASTFAVSGGRKPSAKGNRVKGRSEGTIKKSE